MLGGHRGCMGTDPSPHLHICAYCTPRNASVRSSHPRVTTFWAPMGTEILTDSLCGLGSPQRSSLLAFKMLLTLHCQLQGSLYTKVQCERGWMSDRGQRWIE